MTRLQLWNFLSGYGCSSDTRFNVFGLACSFWFNGSPFIGLTFPLTAGY
jgi:hypothetical protein